MMKPDLIGSFDQTSPKLPRRRLLQLLGGLAATASVELVLPATVFSQDSISPNLDDQTENRVRPIPEELFLPDQITSRASTIRAPKVIEEYLGKNPARENSAVDNYKLIIGFAKGFASIGGKAAEIARAAGWIESKLSQRERPHDNGMSFLTEFAPKNISRIGFMAAPDGCFDEIKDPLKCPPIDVERPYLNRYLKVSEVNDWRFINHVIVPGQSLAIDPHDLEGVLRLVQIVEGIKATDQRCREDLTQGQPLNFAQISNDAKNSSWLVSLKLADGLINESPEWWRLNPEFSQFYQGFQEANAIGSDQVLEYLNSHNIR